MRIGEDRLSAVIEERNRVFSLARNLADRLKTTPRKDRLYNHFLELKKDKEKYLKKLDVEIEQLKNCKTNEEIEIVVSDTNEFREQETNFEKHSSNDRRMDFSFQFGSRLLRPYRKRNCRPELQRFCRIKDLYRPGTVMAAVLARLSTDWSSYEDVFGVLVEHHLYDMVTANKVLDVIERFFKGEFCRNGWHGIWQKNGDDIKIMISPLDIWDGKNFPADINIKVKSRYCCF